MAEVAYIHQPVPLNALVLELVATGQTYKQAALTLGLTRSRVAGIVFRAKGGARPAKRTPKQRPRARTVTISGHILECQPMSESDKKRQFEAMAMREGAGWWVMVPNTLRGRPMRHRAGRIIPETFTKSEAEARHLSYSAWGFY